MAYELFQLEASRGNFRGFSSNSGRSAQTDGILGSLKTNLRCRPHRRIEVSLLIRRPPARDRERQCLSASAQR